MKYLLRHGKEFIITISPTSSSLCGVSAAGNTNTTVNVTPFAIRK